MTTITKQIIISSAIALAGLAFTLFSEGCKSDSSRAANGNGNNADLYGVSQSTTYEMAKADPPKGGYIIYLDASGSMPGYFTDGLTDYISIVSALKGAVDSTRVYFWGNLIHEVSDINSDITKHNYTAKSSLFEDIFKSMADDVAKEDVLTFIITDGIVSNSSNVTNLRTGYTKSDLPLLPNKIKQSLKNDSVNLAIALFRFELPFNGQYADIDNKSIPITVTDRPLFVFAIGKPGAITDFKYNVMCKKEMEDFNKKKPDALYLGLLEKRDDTCLFSDNSESGKGFTAPEDGSKDNIVVLPNGVDEFDVYTSVPEWIAKDGVDTKKAGKLTVVSNDGTESENFTATVKVNQLNISTKGDPIDPGTYTLTYIITYRPADSWSDFSCDDDRAINENEDIKKKTFGMSELIKGFELATQHPDTIYKASFKFEKQ